MQGESAPDPASAGVPRLCHLRARARLPGALRGRAARSSTRPVSLEAAREALADARRACDLVDDPAKNPGIRCRCTAAGQDNCAVGRLRVDCAFANGLAFWVSGDQLLRGAALNAVEIAELL